MPTKSGSNIALEVCVDSVESAVAAERGGADRIELCSVPSVGGITPGEGLIAETRAAVRLAVYVLIRPRPGDYSFSSSEMKIMEWDILRAKELGADGVAVGVLRNDHSVDVARTRALAEAAQPMSVTFHRAFDEARHPFRALELIAGAGIQRILTSGQRASAVEGRELIRDLVDHADRRISIVAGSGINAANVRRLVAGTGVREVHVGSGVSVHVPRGKRPSLFAAERFMVSAERVHKLVEVLQRLA